MGHKIPAGSIVMGNHFAITRDESVFGERQDEFIPERWLDEHGSLKDLPLTGFGFGRRICSGRNIARNGLFIHVAKMLWAFDVEVGISGATGVREVVDDMAGSEGFVFVPTPFKAVFRPRDQRARDLIEGQGSTHDVDHAELLDMAGSDRIAKLDKAQ